MRKTNKYLNMKKVMLVFGTRPEAIKMAPLVKELEKLGIGRPSTYASIMTAIQSRGYVTKGESEGDEREVTEFRLENQVITQGIVKEKYGANKGKLMPTPIGELISGFLTDNFKNIVDYKFTANIEKDLDLIAEEKLKDEETRKYIENALRDGAVKTTGTDIDKLMPPVSRFGGGNRAAKKQGVIDKIKAFFEKYFGIV